MASNTAVSPDRAAQPPSLGAPVSERFRPGHPADHPSSPRPLLPALVRRVAPLLADVAVPLALLVVYCFGLIGEPPLLLPDARLELLLVVLGLFLLLTWWLRWNQRRRHRGFLR